MKRLSVVHSALTLCLLGGLGETLAQEGQPLYVYPPQTQTPAVPVVPAPVPATENPLPVLVPVAPLPSMPSPIPASTTTVPVPAEPVPAPPVVPLPSLSPVPTAAPSPTMFKPLPQNATTLERWRGWLGLAASGSSGAVNFGVSRPLMQVAGVQLVARGLAAAGMQAGSDAALPDLTLRADLFGERTLGRGTAYAGPGVAVGLDGSSALGLSLGYRVSLNDTRFGAYVEGSANRSWNSPSGRTGGVGLRTGLSYRF